MNALRTKEGVQFARIAPAGFRILAALQTAVAVFERDLVITCGTEGHGSADPHTLGEAYDVRAQGLPVETTLALVSYWKQQLGAAFTVLYECPQRPSGPLADVAYINPHATAPHFHLQRKAGTTYPSETP